MSLPDSGANVRKTPSFLSFRHARVELVGSESRHLDQLDPTRRGALNSFKSHMHFHQQQPPESFHPTVWECLYILHSISLPGCSASAAKGSSFS
eukprot:764866-Hanusia_phi.AAC.1